MKSLILLFFLVSNSAHAYPLSISGSKCEGGEIAVAQLNGQWADFECTSREWLISVNRIKSEISPILFTGKLNKSRVKKSAFYLYYNIVPTIPVSPQTRWVLRRHLVRVSPSGELNIVQK